MKEIAEMLKRLGPNYTLVWEMDYFGQERLLIMTLIYMDTVLHFKLQSKKQIPFNEIEHMDQYGSQLLEDMHRAIQDEKMKTYAKL